MRGFTFVVFIVSIIACNKGKHRNNEIVRVELAYYSSIEVKGAIIDIDSSLNYNFYKFSRFYRHPDKDQSFYYKGKLEPLFWDTLNIKFEKIKYKTLDSINECQALDGEGYELIVHWKNGRKRLLRSIPCQTDSLIRILDWLDSSYKRVSLKQTKTPFKFETTIQILPTPKIDQVKFPPPVK